MERVQEVLVALRRIIRATDLHSKSLAKNTGLTAPQMLLLQTLNRGNGETVGGLAKHMNLSQATVTTILDRLEKKALIFRERSCTDRRKVLVNLKDEALEILKDAPIPLQEQFTRQFGALQDWEQMMIISSLGRIAEMMDAQDIDAAPVLDLHALDPQPEVK